MEEQRSRRAICAVHREAPGREWGARGSLHSGVPLWQASSGPGALALSCWWDAALHEAGSAADSASLIVLCVSAAGLR